MTASGGVRRFADELAQSRITALLQETSWAVPLLQTVHLLGIAAVTTASVLLSCRALRGGASALPGRHELTGPFWAGLAVVAATGTLLVLAEPDRALPNSAFRLKLILLAAALIVTLPALRRPRPAKAVALAAPLLWAGAITAGRMIGYTGA